MNKVVRAPRPLQPPAPRGPLPFRRALLWVVLGHLLVLLAFLFDRSFLKPKPAEPPPGAVMDFIPIPANAGSAERNPEPAPAPAPTPAPQSTPTPPTPEPTPTPPAPAPEPTPEPTPAPIVQPPSQIVIPKPVPKPVTVPAPTPAPEVKKPEKPEKPKKPETAPAEPTPPAEKKPKAEHTPKVNLTPVTRADTPSHSATQSQVQASMAHPGANPNAAGDGHGQGLKPSGVSDRLSKALSGSGATAPVVVGPSGGGGGGGNGSWYYGLIRDEMYRAWSQPDDLSGKGLSTVVRVSIAADGRVTGAEIARSSGNPAFDQSALGAARRVSRLSKPKPEDIPESVTITFQLLD